ncbi:transposase, partial [Pectobacterium parmentieri]|nr:transposase [Pectobacterium parmentieri]
VALLLDSGKSVARMAQELDIKENTLYNWKKLYRRRKHSMLGYQTLVDYEMAA